MMASMGDRREDSTTIASSWADPNPQQTSPLASWHETALDWYQRDRRRRRRRREAERSGFQGPHSPAAAAWAFFRPPTLPPESIHTAGTQVSFIDAALRYPMRAASTATTTPPTMLGYNQQNHNQQTPQLPIMEIRGSAGKTWTLISLAANFVVATRPSLWRSSGTTVDSSRRPRLPRVFILDSAWGVSVSKIYHTVRSQLLRRWNDHVHTAHPSSLLVRDQNNADAHDDTASRLQERFQQDLEDCLSRIHLETATGSFVDWAPILEQLRHELMSQTNDEDDDDSCPTLLLWDGFLHERPEESTRTEVIRMLARLVQETPTCVITTIPSTTSLPSGSNHLSSSFEWNRYVTHRIRLERKADADIGAHEFLAVVGQSQLPFSITQSGILS